MIYLGLDLGKLRDFTAWAAVEENGYGELEVRHLERAALGTPYVRVVERTAEMSRHPAMNGRCHLVMDGTGVGNPVEEALRVARGGWRGITAVSITGGDRARQASGYGVGERLECPAEGFVERRAGVAREGEVEDCGADAGDAGAGEGVGADADWGRWR